MNMIHTLIFLDVETFYIHMYSVLSTTEYLRQECAQFGKDFFGRTIMSKVVRETNSGSLCREIQPQGKRPHVAHLHIYN